MISGYCFGGAAVLEAARAGAEINGFAAFHAGLGTPEGQDYSATTAPIVLFHGSADPVSGMADMAAALDAMQAAGVAHEAMIFGGARHSFTVWGSNDYDLAADEGSWDGFMAFLDDRL
ncbi:Dienelactone hydrolase family protein [Roseivivax lentus]|uniref:Dienelactone hydrolase family protein n=1 Tax=Roseivivax lentus TaxID=633194 RepID=A0A1N7K5G5_9RHOB|nr:dienelactone hydrolase family protein [Roseivivax lentus]SIS56808.1 Dienelactone hydrolase family protein [Roseivivax lentus]